MNRHTDMEQGFIARIRLIDTYDPSNPNKTRMASDLSVQAENVLRSLEPGWYGLVMDFNYRPRDTE